MKRVIAIGISLGLTGLACAVGLKEEEVVGIAGFQHTGSLAEIVCLADGKHVLSTSRDGYAARWEIESGKLVRRFDKQGSGSMWGIRVLPGDKEFIVGTGANAVVRFDIATGKELMSYMHSDGVYRVAVHPDGERFVGVDDDNFAILWKLEPEKKNRNNLEVEEEEPKPPNSEDKKKPKEVEDEESELGEIRKFKGHKGRVFTAIFIEDGKLMVTGSSDGKLKVWEVETGKCIETSKDDFDDVYTLAPSPDGKQFAMASEDKFVRVFNSKTRKVDWKVKLKEEGEVLAWSPDGKLVAIADGDRFLHVLDAKDGAEVRKITVADSRHTPITFSNDSRMLISGGDQHLHLHDVETGKRITPGLGIPAAPKGFETFAVGPEGRRIYAGIDEKLYSWNRDAKGERSMVNEKETIYSLAVSPNGEEFGVGLEGGEIRIRGVEDKELKSTLDTGSLVNAMVFSPTGKSVISGGNDGSVAQWALGNGGRIQNFKGHTGMVTDLAVASDGRSFASVSDDDSVRIWSLRRKVALARLPLTDRKPTSFAFLDNGRSVLAAVRDKNNQKNEVWGRFLPKLEAKVQVSVARIEELVVKLADVSFEARNAATEELFAMGEDVLPHLAKIKSRDPEVAARLEGVREMILGKGGKNAMKVVHNFKSSLYHLAGDPSGKYWAGVVGSGTSAKIVLGEIVDEKLKVLDEIGSKRHPDAVSFSANGKTLVSKNEDGTLTVYSIGEKE